MVETRSGVTINFTARDSIYGRRSSLPVKKMKDVCCNSEKPLTGPEGAPRRRGEISQRLDRLAGRGFLVGGQEACALEAFLWADGAQTQRAGDSRAWGLEGKKRGGEYGELERTPGHSLDPVRTKEPVADPLWGQSEARGEG